MRSERFGLILTSGEKEAMRLLAEAEGGLSQAAVLRRLIRQEAQGRGLWPAPRRTGAAEPQEASDAN